MAIEAKAPSIGDSAYTRDKIFGDNATKMNDRDTSIIVVSDGTSRALDITGETRNNAVVTKTDNTRPVVWDYNLAFNNSETVTQLTDIHGVDMFTEVASTTAGGLEFVQLYPFESKVHYYLTPTLKGMVGSFFEASNRGNGSVDRVDALQIRAENYGTGSVDTLKGIKIDAPRNNGVVLNSYGIHISDIRVGTGDNKAIQSDGGDVEFNGDLKLRSAGSLEAYGDVKARGKVNCRHNEYADNASAISAGLLYGDHYRTGDIVKVVH